MYAFTSMPPMPPRESDVTSRAHSVREVISYVEHVKDPVVCLAPEGMDNPGGALAVPPSGVGRFILQLSNRGMIIHPAGVWELEGRLCIGFGVPYRLSLEANLSVHDRDNCAAKVVMQSIADLLPTYLRGDYS